MDKASVRRNIILYKIYVLFNEPLFWGPSLITSIQKLGHMSLPDIYFLESATMILCVLLDIPSGALADLIGKKKVLIIGRIFLLLSMFGFALTIGPKTAWLANILWAIGYSFQSGADVSLFYNSLKSRGLEHIYKKIEGKAFGSRLLLTGLCALIVGPLADVNLRIPLLLCIPFVMISVVAVFYFEEPAPTKKYSVRKQIALLKEGVHFVLNKREVRWIVLFGALMTGASKIWFFTYNPYFERVHLDMKYYGFVFFLLNIIAWLSSHYAYRVERCMSESRSIVIMILCIGIPVIVMGLVPITPCVYLVLFQNIVRGFIRPFNSDYMNRHIIADDIRTTINSVQSTTADSISIVTLSLFGLLVARIHVLNSLVVLGIVVLCLGCFSYRSYKRLDR